MRGAVIQMFWTPFLCLVSSSNIAENKFPQRDKSPSIANTEASASSVSGSPSSGKESKAN